MLREFPSEHKIPALVYYPIKERGKLLEIQDDFLSDEQWEKVQTGVGAGISSCLAILGCIILWLYKQFKRDIHRILKAGSIKYFIFLPITKG